MFETKQQVQSLPLFKCNKCKLMFNSLEGNTFFFYGFYCENCLTEEKWFAKQITRLNERKAIETYDDL